MVLTYKRLDNLLKFGTHASSYTIKRPVAQVKVAKITVEVEIQEKLMSTLTQSSPESSVKRGLEDLPDGFLEGAPDLVVEILSPDNTTEEIHTKIVEYFENSARLIWVVHPNEHYVLVYRSSKEPDRLLKSTDSLDGENVVSGFSLPVAELFQKLAF